MVGWCLGVCCAETRCFVSCDVWKGYTATTVIITTVMNIHTVSVLHTYCVPSAVLRLLLCVLCCVLVAQSCLTSCDPWTVACQASLSTGFSRQEYWSGLPFPSLGDLPSPGIKPGSPALQRDSWPSEPPGKPFSSRKDQRQGSKKRRRKKNLPLNSMISLALKIIMIKS